jgi:anti-sigma factor RsiW
MDCKTASDLLPLYFDGELDRATSREFEAHLDECAACRDALVQLDSLRHALRSETARYGAPASLRARIAQSAEAPPVTQTPRTRTHTRWLAMAASWVLAFVAGGLTLGLWNQGSAGASDAAQLHRDLFASHWRALAATSPIDVVSTDQHTVKPWFAGKVAMAPAVHDFADQGYALMGGRIDYVGSERVPVLVYRHGKHLIDVFVLPEMASSAARDVVTAQGYVLEAATLGGQRAMIVSDMDRVELTRFRDLLETPIPDH